MKLRDLFPTKKLSDDLGNRDIEEVVCQNENRGKHSLLFLWKSVNGATPQFNKNADALPVAVVTDVPSLSFDNIPVLYVKNARRSYANAMATFCQIDFSKLKCVGITGTNGKTTTATLLAHMLRQSGKKVGTFLTGSIVSNETKLSAPTYSMTTPDPGVLYPMLRRMADDGCEYVIMEVSSHALQLDKISPIPFDIGIFTNLSEEHRDFHKGMEEYYQAKKKLFSQVKHAYINVDDLSGRRLFDEMDIPKTSVGVVSPAAVCAKCVSDRGLDGSSFLFHTETLSFIQRLPLPGIYNVYNALLALCAAMHLGIAPKDAKKYIAAFSGVPGRMEKIWDHPTVYLDYAHTPESLRYAAKMIRSVKTIDQKFWLIFGCGGNRDCEKRAEMAQTAQQFADFTVVTEDNSRSELPDSIFSDIEKGFSCSENHVTIPNRKQAICYVISAADKNDIVLLAGKGCETYIIDKNGYHDFNEKEIVYSVVKKTE